MTELSQAVSDADHALRRLQEILGKLGDGDLHRAHRGGGWTVAQIVSHISVSNLLWLGNMQRLRDDAELAFIFREEVGHDAAGYAPPTTENAIRRLEATRRSIAQSVPAIEAPVLARTVSIPDLGEMTVAEWTPLILGHLSGHVQQAIEALEDRGVLPEGM